MARPTKYKPEMLPTIIQLLSSGKTISESATAIGISDATIYDWTNKDSPRYIEEFTDGFEVAYKAGVTKVRERTKTGKKRSRKNYHKTQPNRHNSRAFIYYHVKNWGATTSKIIKNKYGFTVSELINHFKELLVDGMTKENYGVVWEIDHIKPMKDFDLSCDIDFKKVWQLSNLRPLWSRYNQGKRLINGEQSRTQ